MRLRDAAGMRPDRLAWVLALALLAGCTARGPAPVSERAAATRTAAPPAPPARPATPQIEASTDGRHVVQRGDTLYAIAFANSLDYREVAAWNRLASPDLILVGQVLQLTPPAAVVEIRPLDAQPELSPQPLSTIPLLTTPQAVLLDYSEADWARVSGTARVAATPAAGPAEARPAPVVRPPAAVSAMNPASAPAAANTVERWLWPADGILAGRFGAAGGKGIDIVGTRNAPVRAVAPGKVVYSGTGLRGYGHLLIVKHAGEFLSAYAHNERVLVKEGETVAAGQLIAAMGDSGADRVKLHFEIRRYGKPLDPLDYLPERS